MSVSVRNASDADFIFARDVYFQTMRWNIERLFGWDQPAEDRCCAQFFKVEEARIILADGRDNRGLPLTIDSTETSCVNQTC